MRAAAAKQQYLRRICAALAATGFLLLGNPASAVDLYRELGGISGIERITTALLDRVFADDRIAFLFDDENREYLHDRVAEQICMETGGPCEYKGLSMARVHGGLDIRHNEFDAFVEDFILGMEDAGVPYRVQNRVLKIFAAMREDIVYR